MWQLLAITILLAGLLSIQASVHAQSGLRLKLSATVAPTCRIVDQAVSPQGEGVRVRLQMYCNVLNYRLEFPEDAGPVTVLSTSGVEARFDPSLNAIKVETTTPGPQQMSFSMRDREGIAGMRLITDEE